MLFTCAYLGGIPGLPGPIEIVELTTEGLDLSLTRVDADKGSTMGIAIVSKKSQRTHVANIAADEVIALEADQSKAGLSIPLGGVVGVTDDFFVGLGGVLRTEGEGTLTLLIERNGQRHMVGFSAATGATLGFAYAYQLARIRAGRGPLPGLFEVDAVLRAEREARVQEQILASLQELVAAQ